MELDKLLLNAVFKHGTRTVNVKCCFFILLFSNMVRMLVRCCLSQEYLKKKLCGFFFLKRTNTFQRLDHVKVFWYKRWWVIILTYRCQYVYFLAALPWPFLVTLLSPWCVWVVLIVLCNTRNKVLWRFKYFAPKQSIIRDTQSNFQTIFEVSHSYLASYYRPRIKNASGKPQVYILLMLFAF